MKLRGIRDVLDNHPQLRNSSGYAVYHVKQASEVFCSLSKHVMDAVFLSVEGDMPDTLPGDFVFVSYRMTESEPDRASLRFRVWQDTLMPIL